MKREVDTRLGPSKIHEQLSAYSGPPTPPPEVSEQEETKSKVEADAGAW